MRTPPSDVQAERAVLGSILIDAGRETLRLAQRLLPDPEMFYYDQHRLIFREMCAMGPDVPIDLITLPARLRAAWALA